MSRQEFFSELQERLRGQVSDREYRDSISYYQDYFREQEALGRSEQEILDELGSARYIAHSIIDAHGSEVDGARGASHSGYYDSDAEYSDGYGNSGDSYQNSGNSYQNSGTGYQNSGNSYQNSGTGYGNGYGSSGYEERREEIVNDPQDGPVDHAIKKVAGVAIVIGVLLLLGVLLNFMLPFILIFIVVLILFNMFRGL